MPSSPRFQETKRFTQIMKHPQFLANPAIAITQHLKNSMAAVSVLHLPSSIDI